MDNHKSGLQSEQELFRRYRASHDRACRDEIFMRFLDLVESVARGYTRAAPGERDDFLQVGYVGLLGAIERFDPERGVRFSTYAAQCIEGEIRHYIRDKSEVIRRPRWMRRLSSQVAGFLEVFYQQQSRLPTLTEISSALNIAEDGVVAILRAKSPLSLESDSDGSEKIKSLRQVSLSLPIEDRIVLEQAVEKLLEVERKVVYLFFVHDLTQKQISGLLTLPPRKVSRVMQKALQKLRELMKMDKIAEG